MKERNWNTLTSLARPMRMDHLIRWAGQSVVFPFYHTVSPEPLPHIRHLYRVLKPEEFERDLEQLLRWYEPESLGSYLERNKEKEEGKVWSFPLMTACWAAISISPPF